MCVFATLGVIESNSNYHFSFMDIPAMLTLIILYICLVWFPKSWLHYIWGIFSGLVIFVPMISQLFQGTNNMIALTFDALLSLVIFTYYGYKIYLKLQKDL